MLPIALSMTCRPLVHGVLSIPHSPPVAHPLSSPCCSLIGLSSLQPQDLCICFHLPNMLPSTSLAFLVSLASWLLFMPQSLVKEFSIRNPVTHYLGMIPFHRNIATVVMDCHVLFFGLCLSLSVARRSVKAQTGVICSPLQS